MGLLPLQSLERNRYSVGRLATGQTVRLFNPRLDHWSEHFRLDDGQIVALTPIGRVTEYLLQFNQPQCVQERRWLTEAGRYLGKPADDDVEPGYSADRGGD